MKTLYRLRSVVANGFTWGADDVLAKDVGLLETDGETKLATSVCERADETL